jgi:sigma-B regulation protein RsbU (phosphoserine phosphatase)
MKVLIADDDAVGREILAQTLADMGYEVTCADNGRAAVEAMRQCHYPLLVCDWEMPQMDGLQVCRWVRSGPMARLTYVVMLTAREGMENSAEGLSSGADAFLSKPCQPEDVVDHLRLGQRLLDREAQRASVAS